MNWNDFCKWWESLGQAIGNWFIGTDAKGYNNLERIVFAILILVIGHYVIKGIIALLKKIFGLKTSIEFDVSVKSFTISVLNVTLQFLLALWIIAILGFDLSSVAGILSAITVAIGLSLQNLISSFAAGVVLLRAKHFKTGDYIKVITSTSTVEGTVRRIALMSTSLTTFDNQVVIVPNDSLLKGTITNFSTNNTRRAVFVFGVDYGSDTAKVKKVLLDLVNKDPRVLKTPAPQCFLSNMNEYTLDFSLRFYMRNEDYWNVYNAFTEIVFKAFNKNGINIPFRRVVVENYVPDKIVAASPLPPEKQPLSDK